MTTSQSPISTLQSEVHKPQPAIQTFPPLTLAVLLCTRNRSIELARCLASLVAQTRPADEIWVVDASDGEGETLGGRDAGTQGRRDGATQPATRNPQHIFTTPGLPAQRNLALRQTQADVVAFFDDDVELEPGYLAALMAVYERRWKEGIGGVAGSTPAWRQSSEGAWQLKRLFGLTHVRANGDRVRVLPTLGVVWVAQPEREIPCAALPGHCMSFRRGALTGVDFDESLGGYADGEDIDVSIQVGRRFPLWQTPDARLLHHKSRAERAGLRRRFFTRTRNERYLHRKLMPHTPRYRLAWAWGALGRLLVAAAVGLRQRTLAPVQGVWEGLRQKRDEVMK